MSDTREYVCENCGKTELLSEDEAYHQGWDYPPFMGEWGVVSPRTCHECPISTTLYWKLISGTTIEKLSEHHKKTLQRILAEKN